MKRYGNKYLSALLAFSVLCTSAMPSVIFAEAAESILLQPEVKAEEKLNEAQDGVQEMTTLAESSSEEGIADGLEVEGVTYVPKVGGKETNPITGEVMEAYAQGLKIELYYSGENPDKELYALYQKLHGVNIDGVDYPLADPKDKFAVFTLWEKGLWAYDKYPTGVSIIEDFKKRAKHKVVLTFKDGDKVDTKVYEDEGYQEPIREDEPSTPVPPAPQPPQEPETPSVPEGESPEGIGKAYKVKEVKIEYGDLKTYFADEKEITDNDVSQVDYVIVNGQKYQKPSTLRKHWSGALLVASDSGEDAKIIEQAKTKEPIELVVYFKDGSFFKSVVSAPQPPQEPETPSVPEGESKEGIGKAYKVKEVKIEYGDLKAYFADEKEITDNDVSQVDYVIVNGQKYQKPGTLKKHWSGALLVASDFGEDAKIIEQAKTKDPIELVVYFKDGSFFKSVASAPAPEPPKPPVTPEPPQEPEDPKPPVQPQPPETNSIAGKYVKVTPVLEENLLTIQIESPGDAEETTWWKKKGLLQEDYNKIKSITVNGELFEGTGLFAYSTARNTVSAFNAKVLEAAKKKTPIALTIMFNDNSKLEVNVPSAPPVTPEPPQEPEDPKPPVQPQPPATSSIASNYVGIKTDFDGLQFTIIVEAPGDAEQTDVFKKKGLDIKHFNEIESIQVNRTIFKDNLKADFSYSTARNTIYSARKKVTELIKEGVPTAVIVTFKDKSVLKTEAQVPEEEPPTQPEPPATNSIASKYVKVKPVLAANQFKIEVEAVGDAEKTNWWDKKGLELADYNKIKSITVNGVAFEGKAGFTYSSARNTVESSDENVLNAAKKATPITVTIVFNDNSKLEAKGSEQPLPKPPQEPEQPAPPQGDGVGSKYTISKLELDEEDKELEVTFHQSPVPAHLNMIRKVQINGEEFVLQANEVVKLGDYGVKFVNAKVFEKAKAFGDITKLPIIIFFNDSPLKHNIVEQPQVPELTLDSVLQDGEYTLTFKTYLEGRGSKENKTKEDESTLGGYFDVRAKLQIKGEEKKVSILNKFYADLLLDFAVEKDGTFVSFEKEVLQSRKNGEAEYVQYTTSLKDLKQIHKLAVLGSGPMMGDSSQIGKFELYRKADLVFDSAVTNGWTDYKVIEDKRIERENNDKILNAKLDANGLDKNNDGKVDEKELMEAKGVAKQEAGFNFSSLIDLTGSASSGKVTDISYLEHLGPNVDAIILDANNIEELPENVFKNATGLTHIFLSGNKIEKIHEGAFRNLSKLKYIDFDGNRLESLPKGLFANSTRLSNLSFMNNQLTSVPNDLIKENKRLEELYLQDNRLTQLPDEFFGDKMHSLTRIELSNNQLESLPSDLGNLKALKQINLSNNKIASLPESMKRLKKLEKLDLEYNHLKSLPTDFLVNMVSKGSVYLDLSANRLTSLPLDEMMAALKSGGRKFSKLEINKNYLPINLTAEDREKYEALGVRFENYVDSYFPQMGNAGASASASASRIHAKQEFDLLEMFYWDLGDSVYYGGKDNFQTAEEFMQYLRGDGLDQNGVDRNTPREEAIKQILEKKSLLWRIENVLYKNDREISKEVKENRPTDSLAYTFEDPSMKKGDSYRLERSLYVKGVSGWLRAVESVVEFVATTDAEIKEGDVQEVFVQLNELGKDKPSMANRALEPTAKLVKENGKFKYTIQLKPMNVLGTEGFVEKLSVFINDVKTEVQPSSIEGKNKFYTFVLDQKADKVKVAFTTNIAMMGEKEAELVFTDKPVQPQPEPQPERTVKGYVLTMDKKQASMADKSLDRNIVLKLSQTPNMYDVTLNFAEMEMMGQKAGVDTLAVKANGKTVPAKPVEGKKGSFVFMMPASQVKAENDTEDTEIVLEMTTYPKVAGHDKAVEAVLVLDWNGDFKLPEKPQPQPPIVQPPTTQPQQPEEGKEFKVEMKQVGRDDLSMANSTLNPVAKLIEKEGNFEYVIQAKPLEQGTIKAEIKEFYVYVNDVKTLINPKELSGEYNKEYRFTLSQKQDRVKISIVTTLDFLGEKEAELVFTEKSVQPQPQPERTVKGYVLTMDKKQASMADKSLDRNIVLKPSQTPNMYDVTLNFAEMEMMGQKAGVDTLAVKAMGRTIPAKPVEGKKGSFVFMMPASQVKAENDTEDTEIVLEMTTYPKVAGHDKAVEAVLILDWNGDFKLPEKPQPQPPSTQPPTTSPSDQEEQLSVSVWMKSTDGKVSVGNKALDQTAKVVKKGNSYTYTLTFRSVEFDVGGKSLTGNITSFSVRGQEIQPEGSSYTFELNEKVDELLVSFTVDVMEDLGVGAKDAYIVFDWSGTNSKPDEDRSPSVSGGGSASETTTPLQPKTQISIEKLEKKAEKVLQLPKKQQKYYSEQTLKAIEKALEAQKKGEAGAEQKLAEIVETARVERITNVLQEGYMKGYEGNQFKPNDNMTRAEASMMFADLIDEEIAKTGKMADIKEEAWYTDTMKKLATLDYLKPQKNGNYEPNGQITRAEYAYLLAKLRNLPIGKKNLKDVPKEHWAAEAIAACVEAGIVVGYGDGTFRPEEPITRAEAVVMINRTFNVKTTKVEKSLYKDVPKNHWAYDSIMTASKK